MGVLFDYFAASSDDEAGSVIDRVGGPRSQAVVLSPADEPRRRFLRRQPSTQPQFGTDAELHVFDTVSIKGIDPVVQLGTLEELLTGRPYDDIAEDPRNGHAIAIRDEGERLVLTLTDSLVAALADATTEQLAQVAVPWSQTEEFWGQARPEDLTGFLHDLAGLAHRAHERGDRLYCWVCV